MRRTALAGERISLAHGQSVAMIRKKYSLNVESIGH
jgi:hypothetical protein